MYYELSKKEVLDKLGSSEQGLNSVEAARRSSTYGKNILKREKKISPLHIFLNQFIDPLVIILIIATIISFFLKEVLDAVVILVILILNAVFGFVQEYKAEKSIELLQKLSVTKTKVLRDGKEVLIDSTDLVPGDIVFFEEGDKVTADCRILEEFNLTACDCRFVLLVLLFKGRTIDLVKLRNFFWREEGPHQENPKNDRQQRERKHCGPRTSDSQ